LFDSSEINHSTNDINEYDNETKQRFLNKRRLRDRNIQVW